MPRPEHLVFCGVAPPEHADSRALRLALHGRDANVRLWIQDISSRLVANIPDELVDLLEVAAYIYAADSAISRGGRTDARLGARWRRTLRFVIPVRRPDLWSSGPVYTALTDTLAFLSDENYAFEFRPLVERPPVQGYLEPLGDEPEAFSPQEVILFSGGLDSFAGALEELVARGKPIALVSHRSASKIGSIQKALVADMRARLGSAKVLHVPVLARLEQGLSQEPTHRTRSFLFAALGAVTARLFGLNRVKFFENGVLSLNLPPVGQVVGARATRTTHPQALAGFQKVLTALFGRPFEVANPFMWLTKAEVVERIARHGFVDLIRHTRSCTRVHEMTRNNPHCGHCSQCIDRRFAIFAAGLASEDPEEAYKVDLFIGERPPEPDREMALAYVRSATRIKQMNDEAFFAHFGEASRAVAYFPETADEVGRRIHDLHRRHADGVCRVFDDWVGSHPSALREGSLPSTCLVALVVGQNGENPSAPGPSVPVEEGTRTAPNVRLAIDEERNRVTFERWGVISGAGAALIIALAGPFRAAVRDERAPEHYPFTKTTDLLRRLDCDSDEALRHRIERLRKKITRRAKSLGCPVPAMSAVIENVPWHGYRLNPDSVRIVAPRDLRKPEHVTPSP